MGSAVDGGGDRPRLQSGVIAVAFLIASEIMFFAGLFSAYFILRPGEAALSLLGPGPRFPFWLTAVNTAVLLSSAFAARRSLGLGILLGAAFLLIQGVEWARLIGRGLTLTAGLFGGIFYTLVGAHAAHVFLGLLALGVAAFRPSWIAGTRMYWTFVVALWPVIYVLLYWL